MAKQLIKRTALVLLMCAFAVCLALGIGLLTSHAQSAVAVAEETDPNAHEHTDDGWQSLTADGTLSNGNYYLDDNITGNLTIIGDVTLCLNGYVLHGNGSGSVIRVSNNANFTLCDCNGSNSTHYYTEGTDGLWTVTNTQAGADGSITGGVIIGGNAANGGGVEVDGGEFTMEGGTIAGNTADYGSGVYVDGGTFTMESGTISGNKGAIRGGGVDVEYNGTFKMYGGDISGNTVGQSGGDISGSTIGQSGGDISGSTIGQGGGVYVWGTFEMYGGDISDNTADQSGGGVYISGDSEFTMIEGTISDNTAPSGSGVFIHSSSYSGIFNMKGGYFGENKLYTSSGTVNITGGYFATQPDSSYINSTYTTLQVAPEGSAYPYAVVASNYDTAHTHTGGTAYTALSYTGGRLENDTYYLPADITLENNLTISGTVTLCLNGHVLTGTGNGSVITVNSDANFTLCDCNGSQGTHYYTEDVATGLWTITDEPSGSDGSISGGVITGGTGKEVYNGLSYTFGGGVYVESNTKFTMEGGTIAGNSATEHGGGVYVSDGTFSMEGGTIAGNTADYGGGVYVDSSTFAMSGNATISNNMAGRGGGVEVHGTFNMEGGTISDNTADQSGGVYVNGIFTMEGGTISDNTADQSGGGVYVSEGRFNMEGGTISGNTANYGGGVYVYSNARFTMEGGAISGNTANYGGGVYVWDTFNMEGGAISGNTATSYGGGVYVYGTFTMEGGYFGTNAIDKNVNATANIYGGYFAAQQTNYIAAGNTCVQIDNSDPGYKEGYNYRVGHAHANDDDTYTWFTAISAEGGTLNGGNYYLPYDVTLTNNITIDSDVTLCLNGHILRGNGSGSVITVNSGANFTLCDCGDGADGVPNTITVNGQSKTYNSGVITGGSAQNGSGVNVSGGATFTMNGGTIAGNTKPDVSLSYAVVAYGAGVYVAGGGNFTMNAGTISDNDGNFSGGFTYGGGVYVYSGGIFAMNGGIITNNTAAQGRGVYVSGNFTMTGGYFGENEIGILNGSISISGGYFTSNPGHLASGAECVQINRSDPGYREGYTYRVGHAHENADGSYTWFTSPVLSSGGELNGGYYYLPADITLSNDLTINGTVTLCLNGHILHGTGNGSVITVNSGTFTLCDCNGSNGEHYYNVINNRYVFVTDGSTTDTSIRGGVITGGTGTISGNLIIGGGVYVNESSDFIMQGGTIAGNTASYRGGGVCVDARGIFTMSGGKISGNTAGIHGGGVYLVSYSTFTMNGGEISGNSAQYGGGVYLVQNASFTMQGGAIAGNSATDGGGVYVAASTFTMNDGCFGENAIYIDNYLGGTVYITGGYFANESIINESWLTDEDGNTYILMSVDPSADDYREGYPYQVVAESAAPVKVEYNGEYTYYGTIGEAFTYANGLSTNADSRAIITLQKNAETSSTLTVDSDSYITLDLNGYTLQRGWDSTGYLLTINSGATLTMEGGTIEGSPNGGDNGVFVNGGTFIMNSGEIARFGHVGVELSRSSNASFILNGGTIIENEYNVYVFQNTTFIMNGGTISQSINYGVAMSYGTFTMNGGEISGNSDGGVYVGGSGTFTMTGGYFGSNSIYCYGTVTITGGYFATGDTSNNTAAGFAVAENYFVAAYSDSNYPDYGYQVVSVDEAAAMVGFGENQHYFLTVNEAFTYANELETDNGEGADANGRAIITLQSNVGTPSTLTVDVNKYITLDLNGYVLEYVGSERASVITVNGDFELNDSRYDDTSVNNVINGTTYHSGVITGTGYSGITYGGGVYVEAYSTFTMTGGAIAGNSAMYGGGVYVRGTFTMENGTIAGNSATDSGGGVYVGGSTFIMKNGEISGNTALIAGGGVYANGGTFTMENGEISGNQSYGVYVVEESTFNMKGGYFGDTLYVAVYENVPEWDCYVYISGGYFADDDIITNSEWLTDEVSNSYTAVNISDDDHYGDTGYVDGYPYAVYKLVAMRDTVYYTNDGASRDFNGKPLVCDENGDFYITATYADGGAVPQELITISYKLIGGTGDYTTTAPTNAGTYYIGVNISAVADGANRVYYAGAQIVDDNYFTFTINKIKVAAPEAASGLEYTGKTLTGVAVAENMNGIYTVTGGSATNANDSYIAKVELVDSANYEWADPEFDGTVSWSIAKRELTADMFQVTGSYVYTGAGREATYTFSDDGGNLTAADFEVSYSNNVNAGNSAVITFTSTAGGNYSGSVSLNFTISKATYNMSGISFGNATYTYDGSERTLAISGILPSGVTVTYTNNGHANAGTYTVTASFSGDTVNYNAIQSMTATLTINKATYDMSGISFADATYTYNGTERTLVITGTLPSGVTVSYTTNTLTNVGSIEVTASFAGDTANYNAISDMEATLKIDPKNISGAEITLDTSLTYDGTAQEQTIASVTVDGLFVTYNVSGNVETNAGDYTLTVTGTGNFTGTANADWSIAKRELTADMFQVTGSYVYTGAGREATYTFSDDGGNLTAADFEVSYSNNVNAGNSAVITFTSTAGGNYSGSVSLNFTISKATYNMSGISFGNATYTYDGGEKSLAISGTLPSGVTVTYTNNGHTNAGTYTVTASFTGNANYNDIADMTATLTINKATYDMSGVLFNDAAYTYDGSEKTLVITGTLPSGVTVSYTTNSLTNAGSLEVTASFTGNANYNAIADMTATLTINKATYDMSGVSFEDASYTYDGSEKTLAISGTLPSGVTVSYTANTLTNAGSLEVTASFAGDTVNYNAIADMTATLTIEKAVPAYTLPEGITAITGQTLDEIELPDGWSWVEGSLTLNEAGEYTMQAIYTPDDTDNYDTVTVEISVNVQQAADNTIHYIIWGCIAGIAIIGIVIGCIIVVCVKKRRAKTGK